ncbi:hypothetical protein M406DRAFT_343623 [Cryphonectria parasitica EP155]|uniref:Low temperature requirement A n=1 Tax=Cryphonectria parasitica (strain ATCC 38755 / EP155) TaxID=660469 RepID=A0A9P4XQD0_CRYP1|nr:uncharacterized protein M406DRAFT_343623 [Cryphonectria parasitica EP155]KAF3759999.1 hypothetical protein M406DRAFT_343623 [Cryphonectria parasitica EP155]
MEVDAQGLRWIKSPIARRASVQEPLVEMNSDLPYPHQLFFDLFFAANLTLFSDVHQVSSKTKLLSYVEYFYILWFTWALVSLFDVRFVTDSVFERIARAGHLGVMIGLAVVASDFHPENQDERTFRTMSLCLAVSRLILAIQYATVIWHVRGYHRTKLPLAIMASIHLACAIIYIGLTFSFQGYNTLAYVAWYVLALVEGILNIGLSLAFDVLSFRDTHLLNRMVLLTFIILGEGVVVICHAVSSIVVNSNDWTSSTIGFVTAAVGNLYMIWMLYNDWQPAAHLPSIRQLTWALIHFPFHLALILFVGGSAQLIIWWKVTEVLNVLDVTFISEGAANSDTANTAVAVRSEVLHVVNQTAQKLFESFPPKKVWTYVDYNASITDLETLPLVFWGNLSNSVQSAEQANPNEWTRFERTISTLLYTMYNSLLATFEVDSMDEVEWNGNSTQFEYEVTELNDDRRSLVTIYTFVCAGITLILMTILWVICRTKPWFRFDVLRALINLLIGLGLAFVGFVGLNGQALDNFQSSPWTLPTLCLTLFIVMLFNSLPRNKEGHSNVFVSPGGDKKAEHATKSSS